MNTLFHVQAQIDGLQRRAEHERLAAIIRVRRPDRVAAFYQQGRRNLGQGLIWLGSRLHEPMCPPPVVQCTPTAVGRTTFALGECP
jgi:hypothetical protein